MVQIGETFSFGKSYYIRTDEGNIVVNLENGIAVYFADCDNVELVSGTLTIGEYCGEE